MIPINDWRDMRELLHMASRGRVHKTGSLAKYFKQAMAWTREQEGLPPLPPEELDAIAARLSEGTSETDEGDGVNNADQ